jgi:hypothetical protein
VSGIEEKNDSMRQNVRPNDQVRNGRHGQAVDFSDSAVVSVIRR